MKVYVTIKADRDCSCDYGNNCWSGAAVELRAWGRRTFEYCKTHARRVLDRMGYQMEAEEDWQDIDRCWIEVERVYECRWDCPLVPA